MIVLARFMRIETTSTALMALLMFKCYYSAELKIGAQGTPDDESSPVYRQLLGATSLRGHRRSASARQEQNYDTLESK